MVSEMQYTASDVVSALLQLSEVSKEVHKEVVEAAKLKTPPALDNETVQTADAIMLAFVINQINSEEKVEQLINFTPNDFYFLANLLDDSTKIESSSGVSANVWTLQMTLFLCCWWFLNTGANGLFCNNV